MATATEPKTEAPAVPSSVLPQQKKKPSFGLSNGKSIIYGDYKVGKTTLAASLAPDNTLFLATEPGQGAIEAFVQPIKDWADFLIALDALKGEHQFKLVVIDTVDELVRMCADYVIQGMSGGAKGFVHVSDFEWGKGYDAILGEFRLRIGALAQAVPGVIFIAHEDEKSVKERNGLEVTKFAPKIGSKGVRGWLMGFVDYIFCAHVIQTAEGEQHVLQLKSTENIHAGARIPEDLEENLPDAIPLRAADLITTFRNLNAKPKKTTDKENE